MLRRPSRAILLPQQVKLDAQNYLLDINMLHFILSIHLSTCPNNKKSKYKSYYITVQLTISVAVNYALFYRKFSNLE